MVVGVVVVVGGVNNTPIRKLLGYSLRIKWYILNIFFSVINKDKSRCRRKRRGGTF